MLNEYRWLENIISKLNHAQINYKKEWQAYQFLLANKMFAMMGHNNHQQPILTLKGDPDQNRALIEMYDCVTEGYYANKVHWISIILDHPNTLEQKTVEKLLCEAYQLVLQKLPKKLQKELIE